VFQFPKKTDQTGYRGDWKIQISYMRRSEDYPPSVDANGFLAIKREEFVYHFSPPESLSTVPLFDYDDDYDDELCECGDCPECNVPYVPY
jgi:hypothetical protein